MFIFDDTDVSGVLIWSKNAQLCQNSVVHEFVFLTGHIISHGDHAGSGVLLGPQQRA